MTTNTSIHNHSKIAINLDRLKNVFEAAQMSNGPLINDLCKYVETGENAAILLKVSSTPKTGPFDLLQISHAISTAIGREWQPLVYVRLAKILANLHPLLNKQDHVFGNKEVAVWWRFCVSIAFSLHATPVDDVVYLGRSQKRGLDANRLLELASLGEATTTDILNILLTPGISYCEKNELHNFLGIKQWFEDEHRKISTSSSQLSGSVLAQLIAAIGSYNLSPLYLDVLISALTHKAKTVQGNAIVALSNAGKERVENKLRDIYADQTPTIRSQIAISTAIILKKKAVGVLNDWLRTENDTKPKEMIEQQLELLGLSQPKNTKADSTTSYTGFDGSIIAIPPFDLEKAKHHIEFNVIDEKYYQNFHQALENYNAFYASETDGTKKNESWHWTTFCQPIDSDKLVADLKELMTGNVIKAKALQDFFKNAPEHGYDCSGITDFFNNPNLSLHQLMLLARKIRKYRYLNIVLQGGNGFTFKNPIFNKVIEFGDLRLFNHILTKYLNETSLTYDLDPSFLNAIDIRDTKSVWPLIAENRTFIEKAFGLKPSKSDDYHSLSVAMYQLKLLPQVPLSYAMPLIIIAMGRAVDGTAVGKDEREQARALLADLPNLDRFIASLLEDSQQATRTTAANWLKDRGAKSEITALYTALKIEKNDAVRAAILSALSALGEDIGDYFAPEKLLSDAQKGLKKAKLNNLDWFPFAQLPQLHFKNGDIFDLTIVLWWITLAVKLKTPQGNLMTNLWLDQLTPESANKLGLFIVQSWIAQNIIAMDENEAFTYAQTNIDQRLQHNIHISKLFPHMSQYFLTDRDLLFKQLHNEALGTYKQSVIDAKGILALAAHVDGAEIANITRNFLKKHGSRVSQSKALLDMLAGNSASAAIQLLIASARHTKQPSLQDHARNLIDDISQQQGWSFDQLADRTIPAASLDDNGENELKCGKGRVFKLALNGDHLILLNDQGKEVKALPTANPKDTDEVEEITAAKKIISNAKKELKQVIPLQTARLYEAMCLERLWPVDEWQNYIFNHPIMRPIITKLIWIGRNMDGKTVLTFRPLEDGSLTDNHDNAVSLIGIETIKLAHISLLNDKDIQAWRTHLTDYEIAPPFNQFREDLPIISDEIKNAANIDDREGWMIDAPTLRSVANKLGYEHDQHCYGGFFTAYTRYFMSGGYMAYINFTGTSLAERNVLVALTQLEFRQYVKFFKNFNYVDKLQVIPPILLAETIANYHAIAAAGTGFDPDWQKKTSI
ncbi:DUF4132 domain-containing protein [Bartonella sp. HY761]|uniref:DUF4132 domain-containing protein n=1 Tax=Bartonella sp. HY761 TaxID=2979330 RepID=UPI002200F1B9|nr:DUF4132 domain-containing protein [Bartonella sp. HY761]UXN06204.1 DUF4132 domain-containing protein [Bartonella sp. HY761]